MSYATSQEILRANLRDVNEINTLKEMFKKNIVSWLGIIHTIDYYVDRQ
jgi:hypothetical protein